MPERKEFMENWEWNKKKLRREWDKEKLRRLILAIYSACQKPHSGGSVVDETTDFLDDLHRQTLSEFAGEVEKKIVESLPAFPSKDTAETMKPWIEITHESTRNALK